MECIRIDTKGYEGLKVFWNSKLREILVPLAGYGHHRITLMKRYQVCCRVEVMKGGDNGKATPKSLNGFRSEEMDNIKTGRKGAEAFDGLLDGKLRACDGSYSRIVFSDLVSKISYDPIQ